MALRLGRLYPIHFVLLNALLLLELVQFAVSTGERAAFTGANNPTTYVANLLLVQTFVGPGGLSWNGPSWSIAVEFWTYLLFALLFARAGRHVALLAALIAAGALAYMAATSPLGINLFHSGAFARCLFGFAMGVLTYAAFRRREERSLPAGRATVLEFTVSLVAIAAIAVLRPDRWSLAVPLVFPPLIYVFAHEGGRLSRLLLTKPAAMLGLLSYSIYMIHQLIWFRMLNVLQFIDRRTGHRYQLFDPSNDHRFSVGPWLGDVASIAMILIVVGAAYVTYRLVEAPALRWSRRQVLGRSAAAEEPATAAALTF